MTKWMKLTLVVVGLLIGLELLRTGSQQQQQTQVQAQVVRTDSYARAACDTYGRAMRARREGLIDHDTQLGQLQSATRLAVQSDDDGIRAAAGRVQREVNRYFENPGLEKAWVAFGNICALRAG